MRLLWNAIKTTWDRIVKTLARGTRSVEILRVSAEGDLNRLHELLVSDGSLASVGNSAGSPLLRLAAERGHWKIAESLIDHGARFDVRGTGFENKPLHLAAAGGHSEVVRLLIERGADPNAVDVNRETPLHYVLRSGNAETARQLLLGGARPDARNSNDQTALQNASSCGSIPMVQALLDFGADVNARPAAQVQSWHENPDKWPLLDDSDDARPLYGAVCSGSTVLVDLLLQAGADMNALSFGWSALHSAAAKPNPAMVEFLLSRGAALFVKSSDGRTPVEMLSGFRRSAELLRAAMLDGGGTP